MNKASSSEAPVKATSETENLAPGDSEDVFAFPLSYEQQRLWFLSQLVLGSAIYNVPIALRLKGRLHAEALRKALMEIVQRHEVLRTRFVTVEGEPMQLVESAKGPFLELENLCELPRAERDAEAIRRATEEANTPFDLSVGPMLRTKLLQLAEQEHVLLLTMHHIVSDAWSTAVLVREIATLYSDFSHDRPSRLPDLSIQYADYAVWQREVLQGPVLQKQVEYWRWRLEGLPVLELPTKGQRPARPSHLGAKLPVHLPPRLLARLKELARTEDATLFMVLLASFQLLLSRWTGQQDLAVGTPVANRTRMETESLIGFFVNTLVLRTDFSGSPNVRELVKQVRAVCSDAYA
ncbi:MAG TPA: condensation domain-containing protein, partial [Candidatus Angelobacter sp.]